MSLELVRMTLSNSIKLARTSSLELGTIPILHNYYLFEEISF